MPQLLMERIRIYNEQYREGKPQIEDEHYDALLEQVQHALSPKLYGLFRVSLREPGGDIELKYKIGSLRKVTYGTDQLANFLEKHPTDTLLVSAKLDGMGYVATYMNGTLLNCSTTGDGKTGEDITHSARYVLPNLLNFEGVLEIRGEFVMLKFLAEKHGYRNARNGVVGLMKAHDVDFDKISAVRAPAYEVLNSFGTRYEQYKLLSDLGIEIPAHTFMETEGDLEQNLKETLMDYKEGQYLVDGLVICDVQEKPEDSLLPEHTVAFKVNLDVAETVVLDMDIKTSKDGKLCGVAVVKMVDLCGTDVQRASIYNFKLVQESQIGKGAKVMITKAGDIIPKILEVLEPGDLEFEKHWAHCPSCGAKTVREGVDMVCNNPDCFAQKLQSIVSFIKRCGIKGASEASFDNWGIDSVQDLLTFKPVGKNAEKFHETFLDVVFGMPEEDLLCKFNWSGVGEKTLKKYINSLGFEDFVEAIHNDAAVNHPHGTGEKTWANIVLNAEKNLAQFEDIICDPRYHPLHVDELVPVDFKASLAGQSFCCTGKLLYPRKQIEAKIVAIGGVIKSVSKNLDFLVAGEKAGSKLAKAEKLGIKVITLDELEVMMKG